MSNNGTCSRGNGVGKKRAVCNTCTIRLVRLCYERTWWFRVFREPLVAGMVIMGRIYRVKPEEYEVRSQECQGCIRFLKTALKERSSLFRLLNSLIDPLFNRLRNSIVSEQELQEARDHARSLQ